MRILQISNRVPWPLNEGGTIGIYNFTKQFSLSGNEVYLYCLDGLKHNTPVKQAEFELSKYATVFIHPIDTDIKVEDAVKNLFGSTSYNVDRFDNGEFRRAISAVLKEQEFDVVQMEGSYTGPYLDVIRKHHKGLIAMRMHNVEFQIWERLAGNTSNPIKSAYLKLLARRLKRYELELISKVDLVVTVTEDDRTTFEHYHKNANFLVIPAGIDTKHWSYSPTHSLNKWYHLGSLEWTPNKEAVDFYLKNWHAAAAQEIKDFEFHLAGKGIQPEHYPEHNHLRLHQNVADAYHFVKDMDICLVPLLSGSGIRLKILEAMAAGKLVISTTVGAQGIEAKHLEHILIADSREELIQIISQLNTGEINHLAIRANARALVEEKYSIEAVSEKLINYYHEHTK